MRWQVHNPSCHHAAVLIGSWLGLLGAGGQPAKASRPQVDFMGRTTLSVPKCKPLGPASTQVRKQGWAPARRVLETNRMAWQSWCARYQSCLGGHPGGPRGSHACQSCISAKLESAAGCRRTAHRPRQTCGRRASLQTQASGPARPTCMRRLSACSLSRGRHCRGQRRRCQPAQLPTARGRVRRRHQSGAQVPVWSRRSKSKAALVLWVLLWQSHPQMGSKLETSIFLVRPRHLGLACF